MERALQQLRAKVISGDLMPGEQIRQEEMAEKLGVSRVPLREALNLLADQGFLKHRPNSGYFVAKVAPDELVQIMRIMHLLENELLASMEWPDDDSLRRLKDLNQQMRSIAEAPDWTPLVRLNGEFHFEIIGRTRERLIAQELRRIWMRADTFIATAMSDMSARLRTVDEHDEIIASLAKRDHALLMDALEAHRTSTAGRLSQRFLIPPSKLRRDELATDLRTQKPIATLNKAAPSANQ